MKDQEPGESKSTLVGVERTARILQAVEVAETSSLAEIARRTELNEATVLRYLTSLTALGFIERVESSRYRLGWEIFRLGQRVLDGRVPRDAIRPVMEALVAEFNETVNFAIVRQHSILLTEVVESSRAVRKVNFVGQTDPWHASALGKSIMATMPDSEWRAIIEHEGMRHYTKHTITDVDALTAEVNRTRERGYAIDHEEADEELTCVAAAIPTASGPSTSALSISFVTHRTDSELIESASAKIIASAKEIARRLS